MTIDEASGGRSDLALEPLVAAARRYWARRMDAGLLTCETQRLYLTTAERFVRFAGLRRCGGPFKIDAELCRSFAFAAISGQGKTDRRRGRRPAPQTSRIRLIVVRAVWAAGVEAGVAAGPDPTLGVTVMSRQVRELFPLTPGEVVALRLQGRCGPEDTLRPVQVGLALAGASQVEIARVEVADVDLASGVIDLRSRRAGTRLLQMNVTALQVVRARLSLLTRRYARSGGLARTHPLALDHHVDHYAALSLSPMVASSLRRAMDAARITRVGVSPVSLQQYAANAAYGLPLVPWRHRQGGRGDGDTAQV